MEVYRLTSKYPKEEKYNLINQTQSSANGVIAGIAEAQGRYYFADKVRVLYQARGECIETQSHLSVAFGRSYLSEEEFQRLDNEYNGLSVGINKYIQFLRRRKT